MNIKKLVETQEILWQSMRETGYCREYIMGYSHELRWIEANAEKFDVSSYEELCKIRLQGTKPYKISHTTSMYGTFKRFEEDGEFPDRRRHQPLVKKATYYKLSPYFKNIIDLYTEYARDNVHSKNTISKCRSKASCLFYHLQELGYKTLDNVLEKDVLSFFASEDGTNIRSRSYKRDIGMVLKSELGEFNAPARAVAEMLPVIPKKHTNIQFLTEEESNAIHNMLSGKDCPLLRRDKAIGLLLFFTGIRAGDIADLRLNEIDWQNDLIVRRQQKTGNSLDLPLIAVVGNAIYDYISNDRPDVKDDHVFLWNSPPYAELGSDAIWQICEKIYSAAGVRRSPGERRGSHVFRHHLATHLAGKGFAQPVISNTLGHSEPTTLSYDDFIDKLQPNREYFFQAVSGKCFEHSWLETWFRTLWKKANPDIDNVTAYQLRHHYATTNINSWDTDSFEFSDKLLYLAKSMGHRWTQSTLHYYSIVPRLADTIKDASENGFNDIITEVSYEEE